MKKKNIFLRSLIIYCLVLILLIGAGLFVLNRFLVSYEASRPDNAMEEFMADKDRSFWLNGLQELIDQGFNEFTKADALISDFGIDENADISWRSNVGDHESKEYDVRLGSARICTVSLSPAEDVGFGLNSWAVSSWNFNMPGGSDIIISVPNGCTVSINGVEVGSSYINGIGGIEIELEHSFDIAPAAEIYEIKGMKGPAEIKAHDSQGNELEAQSVSATEVAFLTEPSQSFSFCALPDAQVFINGVEISGEYCSPVEFNLGTYADSAIMRYECSELYSEPEISVISGGENVSALDMPIGKCYIPGAGSEIEGEMADFLEDFIYAYIDFSADKNNAAEANFATLSRYLLPGSELYNLTAKTIENIAWATTSDLEYNSISYYDLIPLGEGRYICSISYDISYTLGGRDLDVENGNLILIEEQNGKYYVAAMSAAIE